MDNIIEANKKREDLLKSIRDWGMVIFILTGIIGCSVMESDGATFGWIFTIMGIILCFYMNGRVFDLKKCGGILTRRRLADGDLRGLKKEELERMRLHIFAKHGYNFNVNDGLYYYDKIAKESLSDYQRIRTLLELETICKATGCDKHAILAANHYKLCTHYSQKLLEEMTEKEKDEIRKKLETSTFSVIDEASSTRHLFQVQIGFFNRYYENGHEGIHYYDFKHCDWYNPTTSDINEIYRKMSDIEKYNIEFIKAYESKLQVLKV